MTDRADPGPAEAAPLLWHVVHGYERGGTIQRKSVGFFRSRAVAARILARTRHAPGFRDHPAGWSVHAWPIVGPLDDGGPWALWAGAPGADGDVDDEHPSCRLVALFGARTAALDAQVELAPGEVVQVEAVLLDHAEWQEGFAARRLPRGDARGG